MTNPTAKDINDWVHLSFKAPDGALFDVRAQDGDMLRALTDGALGTGTFDKFTAGFAGANTQVLDAGLNQAVATAQAGGLAAPGALPGLTPPSAPVGLPAPGGAPVQATGGWQQSQQEKRELGSLADGTKLTLQKGQYGYYINAYRSADKFKLNVNLPQGMAPEAVTIESGYQIVANKMAQG